MLPSLLFMLALLGFPIGYSIYMSLHDFTLETLLTGKTDFVGLKNYLEIFSAPEFRTALQHSLIFTFFSILFQFTLGLGLALLFQRAFVGRNLMRGLLLSGWQMPTVVVGTVFLWLFNLDYGLVNPALMSLGILKEPVGWLIKANTALPTLIVANIWLGIPFNMIFLTAGITGLPDDIYEAATVDGASSFQKLIYLTIPLLKPTILAVLMLGFIYTLRVFDVVWIMTKGGPGDATEVLPTYAYRLSMIHFNFGQSAAVSTIILLILLLAAIYYVKNAIAMEKM